MAGVSWDDVKPTGERPRTAGAFALAAVLALALVPVHAAAGQGDVQVIVRGVEGTDLADLAETVSEAGGEVGPLLPIVDGVAASIPSSRLDALEGAAGVATVTPDVALDFLGTTSTTTGVTVAQTATMTKVDPLWRSGLTGRGVTVALVDSGIADVADLRGRVLDGPDLSIDASSAPHRDGFGHGTHLAGIIAGRTTGVAPGATLLNLRVADAEGRTDVSQVIAAIDFLVTQKLRGTTDVDVLALAFGTDARADLATDPLARAVEAAWDAGIVVVVAAGNEGTRLGRLNHPATDPVVLAVGAAELTDLAAAPKKGAAVAGYSSRGDGHRNPDLVAPGTSIVGLRAPGSKADTENPAARIGEDRFRGSGSSQAAAYTAGVVALLLEQRPELTPDQVKQALVETATRTAEKDRRAAGAGLLQAADAVTTKKLQGASQTRVAKGGGSIEAARGSRHLVAPDGTVLQGEVVVGGDAFDGAAWTDGLAAGTNWTDGTWSGSSWSGSSWSGSSWSGSSWSGSSWSGSSWSGSSWSGSSWSGSSWSGSSWSGSSWSGSSWSAHSWE
jgi:serine protease AprX